LRYSLNRNVILLILISKHVFPYYVNAGSQSGYRTLWKLLRSKYGLRVGRETVRLYLRFRDPISVENRRARRLYRRTYHSRGPNHQWHVDGYDKLKKYGLAVSGCIDGFSRRIVWLQVSCTNNDPRVIGWYYLNAVNSMYVCPTQLRSDRGSENSTAAAIQCCLVGTEARECHPSPV
jgi:hypothetical protein